MHTKLQEEKISTAQTVFEEVPKDMLQLLMQIGFVAANKGMFTRAKAIFDGICAVRPQSEEATMGKAMSMVLSGKLTEPTFMLANVIKQNPNNDLARAFLAFILFVSKAYPECAKLTQEIIDHNRDPEAVTIAQALYDQIQIQNLRN